MTISIPFGSFNVCSALVDHNFKYLLETLDYDREKFPGPPRATDVKDMDEYFGDWVDIEEVNREPSTLNAKPDIGAVEIVHYLLSPKN